MNKTGVQKFIEKMDSEEYILTKDISNYIIYSFLATHRKDHPNIMSQREFDEMVFRLYDNWDNLPEHRDKGLLRKAYLGMGMPLKYDEDVYPELIRNLAMSWSDALATRDRKKLH
jgi:hypothetical protein